MLQHKTYIKATKHHFLNNLIHKYILTEIFSDLYLSSANCIISFYIAYIYLVSKYLVMINEYIVILVKFFHRHTIKLINSLYLVN